MKTLVRVVSYLSKLKVNVHHGDRSPEELKTNSTEVSEK